MDQRLIVPRELLNNINVDLESEDGIIETFKQIESSHWRYLDDYRDPNRRRFPSMSIQEFSMKLLRSKGYNVQMSDIQCYLRQYNKHKKNVPTAGVILYHHNSNNPDNGPYFVVVRVRSIRIWSMPKGKQEGNEQLRETAQREFLEETGIELDCLYETTPYRSINKTRFYLVESDVMNHNFEGYNCKEIDEVKWVRVSQVLRNQNAYSKQTVAVAKYLQANI